MEVVEFEDAWEFVEFVGHGVCDECDECDVCGV